MVANEVLVMAVSVCRGCGQRLVHEATLTVEVYGPEVVLTTSAPPEWLEYHHETMGHLVWCSVLCRSVDKAWRELCA